MVTAKDCHILTSYYKKKYKARYKSDPVVNDHTARWGFDSILKGLPLEEVKKLLDYWFSTTSSTRHRIDWFFYNYDKLIESQQLQQEDSLFRAKLRKESAERAKAFEERRANRNK